MVNNMKNTLRSIIIALLAIGLLAGCTDASASISDKKQVILKVGNSTLTREGLYKRMLTDDNANAVVNRAMELIAGSEIETTDAIKTRAQEIYDDYKEKLTSEDQSFEEILKTYGYASTEAFMEYCINSAKAEDLLTKYIDDNWDTLIEENHPLKAKMLYLGATTETASDVLTKAQQVLEEIKNGKPFDEAVEEYSDNKSIGTEKLYVRKDSTLDYNVLQYLLTVTKTGLSDVITNAAVNGYYIVQVTNTNALQMKDDFVKLLKNDADFVEEANRFYFQKHKFTIYDIDIYNTIKENYPAYLVQEESGK